MKTLLPGIFLTAFLMAWSFADGQEIKGDVRYQSADSLTYAGYLRGDWAALIGSGNAALSEGIDFPYLRLRLGYANVMLGNYSRALVHYEKILRDDPSNRVAHYYSYTCNLGLGRAAAALVHASSLDSTLQVPSVAVMSAGLEGGVKLNDDALRGPVSWGSGSLGLKLGNRFMLDQSLAFFSQDLYQFATSGFPIGAKIRQPDRQTEYYVKASLMTGNRLQLLGAFHYLNTTLRNTGYSSYAFLAGASYATPFVSLQADLNAGDINGTAVQQYNFQAMTWPAGNLDVYTLSRFSIQRQGSATQPVFQQVAGFRIAKPLWVEPAVTIGKLDNYFEQDMRYVYNSVDVTNFKIGLTAYVAIKPHLVLQANWTYERKTEDDRNTNYNQHSVTAGITWKR